MCSLAPFLKTIFDTGEWVGGWWSTGQCMELEVGSLREGHREGRSDGGENNLQGLHHPARDVNLDFCPPTSVISWLPAWLATGPVPQSNVRHPLS